jgi:SAM-dependent methyltransferase
MPFGSARFDVVTSFETLEHLEERKRFLAEIRRVLTDNGLVFLSTPNANHTQPVAGRPSNPYHVHEYAPGELRSELGNFFGSVDLSGQVLDERFRVPPFWDEQEKLRADPRRRSRVVLWRAVGKLPYRVADSVSRVLLGQPLYPGEADYRFDAQLVDSAPVLFARCRP